APGRERVGLTDFSARRFSCRAGAAACAATMALSAPAIGATQSTQTTQATATASSGHHYPGDSRHMGDRILRQGMRGQDVRVLQDFLTRAGYATTVDGQFGASTKSHVIRFQKAHKLTANGVVDWTTSQALRAVVAAAA